MGKLRQKSWKNISGKTGSFLLIDILNLIGTPIHELSHLIPALVFGYHIDDVCLYRTRKTAARYGGILGYVKMHHNGTSPLRKFQKNIGLFFIGTGPLFLPPVFLFLLGCILPETVTRLPSAFREGADSFLKALQQLDSTDIIVMFAYLYVIIGVSMNMELSRQDLHMTLRGLLLLELFLLNLSAAAYFTGWNLDIFIDILFQWNLMVCMVGIIAGLFLHLLSLISS
ncbi:MAG: hypothetical protein Q4D60_08380 [Eubacteriales bacterium]|nr:hypothetical protein [Eubacteriales bacterium]